MSKLPRPDDEGADLPPAYTERPTPSLSSAFPSSPSASTSASASGFPPPHPPSSLYTSHLTSHLSSLPSQIRTHQQTYQTAQQALDLAILSRIAPHLETLLSRIATSQYPPSLAELTLVPAAAIPTSWSLSGLNDDRADGHWKGLVRVTAQDEKDASSSEKGRSSTSDTTSSSSVSKSTTYETSLDTEQRTFDSWGRWSDDDPSSAFALSPDAWWWKDETMAQRLARHLNPTNAIEPNVNRVVIRAAAQQIKEEKRQASKWGIFRGSSSTTGNVKSTAAAQPPPSPQPSTDAAGEAERVVMTVKAEEVTFRKENDFGIWESVRGMGIVVRVRVKRA